MFKVVPALFAGLISVLAILFFSSPAKTQPQPTAACSNPSLTVAGNIAVSRPQAVVVADFNNDGKPDVATGNTNGVSVSLGDGAGGFSAATSINTVAGHNVLSIAAADLNGDGNKDLLLGMGQDAGGEAAVVLGNGAGGFGSPKAFFLQPGMTNTVPAVAIGDMNGDTRQDLIVLMTSPFLEINVAVLLGDGANSYTTIINFIPGSGFPRAMAVTDINGDNKLDVIITTLIETGHVSTSLGDGTGHLGLPTSFNVASGPGPLTVGDFNNDGKKDLAVANRSSNDIAVLAGDGLGGYSLLTTIPRVGWSPLALGQGDFDGNGTLDLVVVSGTPGTALLISNHGDGIFAKTGNFFFAPPVLNFEAVALAEGDFNLDSKPDIFVVNQSRNAGWVLLDGCDAVPAQTLLTSNNFTAFESFGGFQAAPGSIDMPVIRVGNLAGAATVEFHTDDGTAIAGKDYVPVSGGFNFAPGDFFTVVSVFMFDDDTTENPETFSLTLSNATGSSPLGNPSAALITIFDDDQQPQMIIDDAEVTEGNSGTASVDFIVSLNHPSALPVSVQYTTADGSATAGSDYQSSSGTVTFAPLQRKQTISVPVNGDVVPEITEMFVVNLSAPTNATIFDSQALGTIHDDDSACPEPSFGPVNNFTVGTNPFDLVTADFNGDGKMDLATANLESANVSLLVGNGNGGFAPAVNFAVPDRPQALAVGDFNSDNKPDLVVIRSASNLGPGGLSILLNDGAGGFLPANSSAVANLRDVAVADFNADGKQDLAIISSNPSSGAGVLSIRFGDGAGGFGPATDYPVGTTPLEVLAVNINADTKPDVVVANQNSSNVSVLLNNGDGTLGATTNIPAGLNPQSVAAGDINSDGKIDLVVPLLSDGMITVLLGDGTGSFSPGSNLTVGARSNRVVLADLNGDGILDLAVSDLSFDISTPLNPGVWVLFGNGGGKFTAATQFFVTRSPFAIVAGNFDSGARADLAFVQLQSTSVGVLLNTCSLSPPGPLVEFNASRINVTEGVGSVTFNVVRSGNTQSQLSVDYAAGDTDRNAVPDCSSKNGTASSRCDYLKTLGTLTFAPNEVLKTLTIPIVDDAFVEGDETFNVVLSNPQGGTLAVPSTLTITIFDNDSQTGSNPIDVPEVFVRQYYIDFLNREPDQSGLNFWVGNFTQCAGDPQCLEVRRVNVSGAFFLSIEFQETGYFVERIYKTAYGDRTGSSTLNGLHLLSVPTISFDQFIVDSQKIRQGVVVGQGNWQQILEMNKQAFAEEFVTTLRFNSTYPPNLTPTQFVDQLNANAGNPLAPTIRAGLINLLTTNQITRWQVLRAIADDPALKTAEFNRAFVLMQYFGYLRRNPDDLTDSNYTGYDFWLTKLNQFNGNFADAEMVKAFINSLEYRQRFGP